MRNFYGCLSACLLLFLCLRGNTQPPVQTSIQDDPKLTAQYINTVDRKLTRFNDETESYTQHALDKMIRTEKAMQKKLARTDSAKAKKLFDYSLDSLQKLKTAITSGVDKTTGKVSRLLNGNYFAYADTLKQSLSFLNASQATSELDALQGRLNSIADIQTYLQQRQQVLTDALGKLPQYAGNLRQLNTQAQYYSAQIQEYKAALKDPEKIERKVLDLLEQTPAFQKLMQSQGQLAGLFASRASFGSIPLSGAIPVVNGLPNRSTLQQFINTNLPATATTNPLSQLQQQSGGGELDQALNKTNSSTTSNPTPNSQKTKPFGRRLEFGFDFQFGKAVNYLPATANIGVKIGYKLNDRFTTGIGLDYLMGMGSGWKDIHITNQGLGLRSYLKWQIKKGWNIQGGAEFNYITSFNSIAQLRQFPAWQPAALLGISKEYRVSNKVRGNFQVLYDFLHRQHIPNTQPILFRLGYDL